MTSAEQVQTSFNFIKGMTDMHTCQV